MADSGKSAFALKVNLSPFLQPGPQHVLNVFLRRSQFYSRYSMVLLLCQNPKVLISSSPGVPGLAEQIFLMAQNLINMEA